MLGAECVEIYVEEKPDMVDSDMDESDGEMPSLTADSDDDDDDDDGAGEN